MSEFYTSVLQYGNKILYRGYKNGRRVHKKLDFSPTLYINTKKPTKYKTLYGQLVEPVSLGSINEAKEYIKRYEDVEGFEVFGMKQFQYQYIAENFKGDISFNIDHMKVMTIDIETSVELGGFPDVKSAQEQILLISAQDKLTKTNIVFGFKPYEKSNDDAFEYRQFKDEYSMLKGFIEFWQGNTPDIITGWNIGGFDIPYLIGRLNRILDESWTKKLSPWNIINSREIPGKFGSTEKVTKWVIVGVVVLDYMELYKKYVQASRESYTLGFISQLELGDTKMELEGSFKEQYTNQWNDFVRYNAKDTALVDRLDEKLKFIEIICTLGYTAKANIADGFGMVKTWDIFIYNYLKAKDIVIPNHTGRAKGDFEGAWVKEPIPGYYGWTMSFDFTGLYPSIMQQWNISPETIMGVIPNVNVERFMNSNFERPDGDFTIAANGAIFSKEKLGIVPEVSKVITDSRKVVKKQMLALEQEYDKTKDKNLLIQIAGLSGKQNAYKTLNNSLYGVMTNHVFRYFDLRVGEAVTLTGQASDQHIELVMNQYMNKIMKTDNVDYVIAGDTDSIYLNVDGLVKQFFPNESLDKTVKLLDKVGEDRFQKVLNASIDHIYNIGNCYKKTMAMKREAIASKAIWTAKKRYAMIVHNSEGVDYTPYKLKIMGMDLIKSSTPVLIRKYLKDALTLIFESDQEALYEFVDDLKKKFLKMTPEEIAFPRGCNDLTKYTDNKAIFKSGTPIHVRGSLIYNHMNRNNKDVVPIKDGDKIKFIYLKVPNPCRENVISFPSFGTLPPDMGLHKYIDYEKQWEKVFIAPLLGITTAIGWNPEKRPSLEDFFI